MKERRPEPSSGLHGLGRDAGWTVATLVVSSGTYVFLAGLAVRSLGKVGFGVFAILTVASSVLTLVDFGLGLTITRATAQSRSGLTEHDPSALRDLVFIANGAYAILGLITLAIFMTAAFFLPSIGGIELKELRLTAALIGTALALSLGTAGWPAVATGARDFKWLGIATMLGSISNAAVVVGSISKIGMAALGLGQLAAVLSSRTILGFRLKSSIDWFRMRIRRPSREGITQVGLVALPLLILAGAGRVIELTDLVVMTSFVSVSATGSYRLGSLLPAQALSFLYKAYDVAFPRLAGASWQDQEDSIRWLSKVACYLGGLGFTWMILSRADAIVLLAGGQDLLAEKILLIFGLVWLANIPAHGLALLVIARGLQSRLVPLVIGETVANIVLSVVLVKVIGPAGVAAATLVTLGISNLLILPALLRSELRAPASFMLWCGLVPAAAGALAAMASLATRALPSPALRLGAGGALAILAASVFGALLTGPSGRSRLKGMLAR